MQPVSFQNFQCFAGVLKNVHHAFTTIYAKIEIQPFWNAHKTKMTYLTIEILFRNGNIASRIAVLNQEKLARFHFLQLFQANKHIWVSFIQFLRVNLQYTKERKSIQANIYRYKPYKPHYNKQQTKFRTNLYHLLCSLRNRAR